MADVIFAGDAGIFKTCTKCGETKPIEAFALRRYAADGRRSACKPCNAAHEASKRRAAGAPEIGSTMRCERCGRDTVRTSSFKKFCDECKPVVARENANAANARYEARRTEPRKRDAEERRRAQKRYAEKNPEKLAAAWQAYNESNREEINRKSRERSQTAERREWRLAYEREQRRKPRVILDGRMKSAIRGALRGEKAGRKWQDIVGYTLDELKAHLERQFLPGMTWENIGDWHVDHIVPKASFNYERPEDGDFKACWALTNLRPLWAQDNHSKGGKRLHLI